jgi:hypothetical protein
MVNVVGVCLMVIAIGTPPPPPRPPPRAPPPPPAPAAPPPPPPPRAGAGSLFAASIVQLPEKSGLACAQPAAGSATNAARATITIIARFMQILLLNMNVLS